MSEEDAAIGVKDNDWVEVYNDHGVYCTRACVSARIPRGVCIVYHSLNELIPFPNRRVSNRKSRWSQQLYSCSLKPNLTSGYAQFSFLQLLGTVGANRDTHVFSTKNG
ncbi:MAG: molybdopterin dinucleotide binding domain-containing protein [Bacteroidia bacterium]